MISVIPVEFFSPMEISKLQTSLCSTLVLSQGKANSRRFWQRKGKQINSLWMPEDIDSGIGSKFEDFCDYKFAIYSLVHSMPSYFELNVKKLTCGRLMHTGTNTFLALHRGGTSLCIIVIMTVTAQETNDNDTVIIRDLNRIREKVNHIWEEYFVWKSCNILENYYEIHGSHGNINEDILVAVDQALSSRPVYTHHISCGSHAFTYLKVPKNSFAENNIEKLFGDEQDIIKLETEDESYNFFYDGITAVLVISNANNYEVVDKVIAMTVFSQLLLNKYEKFSKLAKDIGRRGRKSLYVKGSGEILEKSKLDFEFYNLPLGYYSAIPSKIKIDDAEILSKLFASAELSRKVRKFIEARNALQHFDRVANEAKTSAQQGLSMLSTTLVGLMIFLVALYSFLFEFNTGSDGFNPFEDYNWLLWGNLIIALIFLAVLGNIGSKFNSRTARSYDGKKIKKPEQLI